MEPTTLRKTRKPEDIIRDRIIDMLKCKGWAARHTHGNVYQSGFPDIYSTHRLYGHRWIEVKVPGRHGDRAFTPAQMEFFPILCAHGDGVWVLTSESEAQYQLLFKRCNWSAFLL